MNRDVLLWGVGLAVSLMLSPLLPGIINKVKAFFAGRKGPSVFQLYFDLAKLVAKERIYSVTASGVLQLAPAVMLAATAAAMLFLPHALVLSPLAFPGDVLLFFYLLGTARFITVLGALDTGSSFEGMGSSREMQFSALAEGVIFALLAFLTKLTGNIDLSRMLCIATPSAGHAASVLLAAFALFVVLLAENCRVPFDDPETHLELTMIHEAMILDCGGPDLALILYGSALKLWLFSQLLVTMLLPHTFSGSLSGLLLVIGGVLLTSAVVGAVESSMARYRFLKVPQMLIGSIAIVLLGIGCLVLFEQGGWK